MLPNDDLFVDEWSTAFQLCWITSNHNLWCSSVSLSQQTNKNRSSECPPLVSLQ